MTNAVIAATGLFTPDQSISNEELVAAYNAYADRFNDRHSAEIAEGDVAPLTHSSVEFIEKASGIRSRYVMDRAGILDPARMAPSLPERVFPAGAAIVREGEEGDTAYIIVRGACDVYRMTNGQRVDVAELRPGDVFGEAGVLTGKPRTATVEATMETTVVEVSRQTLSETLRLRSWMGLFVTAIADRFRESDARVQALERQIARLTRSGCG